MVTGSAQLWVADLQLLLHALHLRSGDLPDCVCVEVSQNHLPRTFFFIRER